MKLAEIRLRDYTARRRGKELSQPEIDRKELLAVCDNALEVLETLTRVPLTWHPRGKAERASFDTTVAAYVAARRVMEAIRG